MIISFLDFYQRLAGGKIVDNLLKKTCEEHWEIRHVLTGGIILSKIIKLIFYNHKKEENNLELHNISSLYFSSTIGKNSISLIPHIDNSIKIRGIIKNLIFQILEKNLYKNLLKSSAIVTISNYWKTFLESKGSNNVRIIYVCFDFKLYQRNLKEIEDFKKKYNLNGEIIYIGNCQKSKGVYDVFNQLKNSEYTLVTSGEKRCNLPVMNLNLPYYDYISLLHAARLTITMSLFKEGWCRVAHESMLCGTPVIGSGKGGMSELLEGGKQIICQDISKLPDYIKIILDNESYYKKNAIRYARQDKFHPETFAKQWINLIKTYPSLKIKNHNNIL